MTHVLYAFANVSASGECVSTNAADDQVNFPELLKFKQQNPKVMTLISVGGAANSPNFSAGTGTDAARQKLAESCVAFMKQNGFDGIDIDWEYPTAQEKQNFTELLIELRRRLDAKGGADKRPYLLTIAAPAGASNLRNIDLGQIHPHLDWINLMAYDFALPSRKVADFCAPLKSYDPAIGKHATSNVDAAVQAYLRAGVPSDKLVVGTHFAGIGWQGVPNTNNGLYQTNTGPAKGSWDAAGALPTGSFDYKDITAHYLTTYPRFWHADAQVPWLYSASTGIMISYEDPQSLGVKANYVLTNQLGGIMIWELSADDAQHSLVKAIAGLFAPSTGAMALTLTLNQAALTNVDDAAGRWQFECGKVLENQREVGEYASSKRVVFTGTDTLNKAMLTLTIFFSGERPPGNITLQGDHDFNSGKEIGSVSAASAPFSSHIGKQFSRVGGTLTIQ